MADADRAARSVHIRFARGAGNGDGGSAAERNTRKWDFYVLTTSVELTSHYGAEAMMAVSRSLAGIVISTSRIAESQGLAGYEHGDRGLAAHRICALVLHALGHLNGLGHHPDESNFMFSAKSPQQLDGVDEFDDRQRERLREELMQVADRRLEEDSRYRALHPGLFYLLGAWINRREIVEAILQAKPWEFPIRFGRLTAAGLSALLVMIVTAEVWELAHRQSVGVVAGLSVIAIVSTTLYILFRQQLLVRRRPRLNELTVVANVSGFAIVLAGMLTIYFFMVAIAFAAAGVLFSPNLLHSWAGQPRSTVGAGDYLHLASFAASLSIFIGALGGSFERHTYFRHVIFVDEEV